MKYLLNLFTFATDISFLLTVLGHLSQWSDWLWTMQYLHNAYWWAWLLYTDTNLHKSYFLAGTVIFHLVHSLSNFWLYKTVQQFLKLLHRFIVI